MQNFSSESICHKRKCDKGSKEQRSPLEVRQPDGGNRRPGRTPEKSVPTGVHCTNYKAELETIKEALKLTEEATADQSGAKELIHSDSKTALQKLEDPKAAAQEYLRDDLQKLEKQTQLLILQWIPGYSYCKIDGNKKSRQTFPRGI
ncbi:cell wall enzyme ebsB [Elysia marginata]|uniref:Cell wall enzyme ebsB n=1 Tax=Elysia marginata TaxID=1093978 RepID=A0AAV4HEP0_9GAST|nr:cell wall enzyme ebsB [Elysia marginata]